MDICIMFEELKFATSLGSDNHSGVHPRVLAALTAANRGHAHAYGMDELCRLTDGEFKRVFGAQVEAQYVFTGTAANVLGLAGFVRSYEAVVASSLAHLQVDECGAPEKFLGAKLWTVPTEDGRIFPEQIGELLERMGDQHFSQPRVVSLTQPTELGVCYSLAELRAWREFTRSKNLMLHLDGARLANASVSLGCTLRELTSDIGVDSVSFGGTKNGLMGAEAVLLFSDAAKAGFKFYRKQAMQLSSKTRFLAAQFHAYLHDDLYLEIARHTTSSARRLAEALREFPEIQQPFPVQSNGLFVQLPKAWIHPLRDKFFFYIWDSEKNLCRWMISFDWTERNHADLLNAIREVQKCFPAK
jgi:threonine aldolase